MLISVYALFGLVIWGIAARVLPSRGWPALAVCGLFILDKQAMQLSAP